LEAFTEVDYPKQTSGLTYERYYRSSPDTTALSQLNVGRLGYSWTDNYRRSVVVRNGNAAMPSVATVFRPKGHAVLFGLAQGSWVPDVDIADRLERLVDGSGNAAGWRFTNASDDSVETYDTAGKLLTIRSRAGVLQTLTYSTALTPATVAPGPGLLIQVVDSFGRSLAFTYDSQIRISTITDLNGGVVAYAYDSNSTRRTSIGPPRSPASSTKITVALPPYSTTARGGCSGPSMPTLLREPRSPTAVQQRR
jgi:YD repeat-containing protein